MLGLGNQSGRFEMIRSDRYGFLLVACFVFGCGDTAKTQAAFGCQFAYDESYECAIELSEPESALSPVYESRQGQECSEFVKNLDDGYYWLVGEDEQGVRFDSAVVIGKDGWKYDGKFEVEGATRGNWSFLPEYYWTNSKCQLLRYTSKSVEGKCLNYLFIGPICYEDQNTDSVICEESRCKKRECSFEFPVGTFDSTGLSPSIGCLRSGIEFSIPAMMYAEEKQDSVNVSVTDSVISIVIPNLTVTWTKRPGL